MWLSVHVQRKGYSNPALLSVGSFSNNQIASLATYCSTQRFYNTQAKIYIWCGMFTLQLMTNLVSVPGLKLITKKVFDCLIYTYV